MAPEDRARVAKAARRSGTLLLIDETTADLSIDRPWDDGPFARHARGVATSFSGSGVITIGSLSKSVWGGLRLGWLRADRSMVQRLVQARPAGDLGTPQLEQMLGERIVRALPELLPRRSAQLRVHRDVLRRQLEQHLPSWEVPNVQGGLSLWVGMDRPASSALALLGQSRGISLSAGPKFTIDVPTSALSGCHSAPQSKISPEAFTSWPSAGNSSPEAREPVWANRSGRPRWCSGNTIVQDSSLSPSLQLSGSRTWPPGTEPLGRRGERERDWVHRPGRHGSADGVEPGQSGNAAGGSEPDTRTLRAPWPSLGHKWLRTLTECSKALRARTVTDVRTR